MTWLGMPALAARHAGATGFTLIELLIVVAIIAILAAVAIPNLMSAQRKAKYARTASEAKTGVTQAIVYANDNNRFPQTLQVLRDSGYANIQLLDAWNRTYRLSAVFANQSVPDPNQDVWLCSMGPVGGGGCPAATDPASSLAGFPNTGLNGGVGYSSIYGSFVGY
jgi:prepilin-type N-terminal cleavage/methylation domain-containing protein